MGLSITIHGARGRDTYPCEVLARNAAMAVFRAAKCEPADAQAEYQRQFDALDNKKPGLRPSIEVGMTGLARVWIRALDAAEVAAGEGWHNPSACKVTMAPGER